MLVTADTTLAPKVQLLIKGGTLLGTATATAGHEAVLQTIATQGQLGGNSPPKTYTVTVSGAGRTTGAYTIRIILNAAVENESHGGASNDTRATAQNLGPSFLPLNSAVDSVPPRPTPVGERCSAGWTHSRPITTRSRWPSGNR